MYVVSLLCKLVMLILEVITSNPWMSTLSDVATVLELSGPGDHVMLGLGLPLAMQLNTMLFPSSYSIVISLGGSVIVADPNIKIVLF